MPEPVIIPRSDHPISRQNIDADALKVLYRLRQFNHVAYLVGGSVRDLLLDRTPKDFDIGTSAHPYQVKRLFRNCWIIGTPLSSGAREVRHEGHRGRHIPQADSGGHGRRAGRPVPPVADACERCRWTTAIC